MKDYFFFLNARFTEQLSEYPSRTLYKVVVAYNTASSRKKIRASSRGPVVHDRPQLSATTGQNIA